MIKHIIAFTGPKRCGKDTSAEYVKKMFDYEVLAFAEPMKDILQTTLGISRETLDDFKNYPQSNKIKGITYGGFIFDDEECTEFSTDMRQILQKFGTEVMKKHFGEDVWAAKLIQDARFWDLSTVVISDLRFMNEYNYIKENCEKLTVIRIHKDNLENDSHSSEQEYQNIPADYEVTNNSTQQDLYNKLNKIILQYIED